MQTSIKLFQRRLAYICIGPSTLRGQGSGAKEAAIEFLTKLDLSKFTDIKEPEFKIILNEQTDELNKKIPWGAARKAINIFLFQACLDERVSKEYNLNRILPYLEVPLDNPNAKELVRKAKDEGKTLNWTSIKKLESADNEKFQEFAKSYAEKYALKKGYDDFYRVHLDFFWPLESGSIDS